MASLPKAFKLNSGYTIPSIGMGCWMGGPGVENARLKKGLEEALKAGYRHFDTAAAYANEKEVGEAVRSSGVPREELFITTKLWNSEHHDPKTALEKSLKELDMDYVDLYLIHFPQHTDAKNPFKKAEKEKEVSFNECWRLMEELLGTGKVRSIGVSNFSVKNLKKLLETAKVVPAVNQIEMHPFHPDRSTLDFCNSHGIHVTAYSPLGFTSPSVRGNRTLQAIAEEIGNGTTTAQVALSWAVKRGTSVTPKSSDPKRMRENFTLVELTEDQAERIEHIADDPQMRSRTSTGPWNGKTVFSWTLEELGWETGFHDLERQQKGKM